MNIKAISILTAALMVVAALGGAMLLDRADAATDENFTDEMGLDTVDVVKGQEATVVLLKVSEAEFLPLGYTLTWYVASATEESAGTYSATFDEDGKLGSRTVSADSSSNLESYSVFSSTEKSIAKYQFKMEEVEGNLGHYLLSISIEDGADATFALKCSITGVNGDYSGVPAVYGILKTNVVEPTTSTLDEMTVTVGVPFMKTVMVDGAAVTDADETWYAIGMPEGLSMSPSGVVSGIATGKASGGGEITGPVTVKVYKTTDGDSGITITPYTLVITVSKPTGGISITISVDDVEKNPSTSYSVQQNSTVKLKVAADPGSILEVAYVSIIGDNGVTYLEYGEEDATIPTSGIGEYTIAVHAVVDGAAMTESVTLQVISDLDVLTPSIVITGA